MFNQKKEDKSKLPDLPVYRGMTNTEGDSEKSFPEFFKPEEEDNISAEKQGFPSFPDSMNNRGFSQAAIKEAVGSSFPGGFDGVKPLTGGVGPYLNASPPSFKTVEMEEWSPTGREQNFPDTNNRQFLGDLKEPPASNFTRDVSPQIKNKDLFVKLDKFYVARKSLINAQQKLSDIDELLRRIRDMKMREEQEIGSWEKELLNIKARINDVVVNLFEKVD